MIYKASWVAVALFTCFVGFVIGLSFYLGNRSKSSKGYFAAGGTIHWAVNGVAFAGDYLSAASFLGICGMIAFYGYDGFLYSIGYLAGWVVALFVVAEPLKHLGEYTFADALDSQYKSKMIQSMAAISTLVVSMFYLIPQMVGAGVLVTPLLGFPHYVGVIMVGVIVVIIVATAGMTSTTYVQFLKGGLLIIFSLILVGSVLIRGLSRDPSNKEAQYHDFKTIDVNVTGSEVQSLKDSSYQLITQHESKGTTLVKLEQSGVVSWWSLDKEESVLREALSKIKMADGKILYNGYPKEEQKFFSVGHLNEIVYKGKKVDKTDRLGIFSFFATLNQSEIIRFSKKYVDDGNDKAEIWVQNPTSGKRIMRPGLKFKIDQGATIWDKLNFMSLMLALFFGTAALPHVLIRYYTVPSASDARKSTIVAIGAIGLFYILTLYMGLGAMTSGVLDVESSNMAAPLLAKSFGIILFSIISAIAFATVLGTVSGLIVASSGAVAHDLMHSFFKIKMTDKQKVLAGKVAAMVVGAIAIMLGILFKGMNVSFLVGWAFAVAASANLPAILMLLFWKRTTSKGIAASILVGMVAAITIILLSPSMFERYGLPGQAPIPLDNPAIISVPLSFFTLVVVSLLTPPDKLEDQKAQV
ncbi:MAG: cation acetate symporter [Spirochaetes bacterium]|nr:cation acetate symporter [Spirochaetota bacterium]